MSNQNNQMTEFEAGEVLFQLILDGAVDQVRAHLDTYPQLLNKQIYKRTPGTGVGGGGVSGVPLFLAIRTQHLNLPLHNDLVELLVSRGADLYNTNDRGHTPFDFARLIGATEMAAYFLRKGYDFSNENLSLDKRTLPKDIGLAEIYLDESIARRRTVKPVTLHQFAEMAFNERDYPRLDKFLAQYPSVINDNVVAGLPMLVRASGQGDLRMMNYLLDKGASIYAQKRFEDGSPYISGNAMSAATYHAKSEAMELLFQRGYVLGHPDTPFVDHPVTLALNRSTDSETALYLLDHLHDPQQIFDYWLYFSAASNGRIDVLKRLDKILDTAGIKPAQDFYSAALAFASSAKNTDTMLEVGKHILDKGADPNAVIPCSSRLFARDVIDPTTAQAMKSALKAARADTRKIPFVRLLIEHGANPDYANADGTKDTLERKADGSAELLHLLHNAGNIHADKICAVLRHGGDKPLPLPKRKPQP